jgi:hypothetical protein
MRRARHLRLVIQLLELVVAIGIFLAAIHVF